MKGVKVQNSYARALPFYSKIPKAVIAAIAVSFASRGGEDMLGMSQAILREWEALHANGIVKQKPLKYGETMKDGV